MIRDDLTRMVVLDDDPTGIQTVHSCRLLTFWDVPTLREALDDPIAFFYLLTNTRAMTREQTVAVIEDAVRSVLRANQGKGYRLIFISRSDSCLRGHFPLETDVIQRVLRENGIPVWHPIPFVPAFIEAGRVTIHGEHFMREGDRLIPLSETEFARDNVFGYSTSVLRDYVAEKGASPDDYEMVDADSYQPLNTFVDSLFRRTASFDGAVVIRSSSSLPRAMSGIADQPLLGCEILKEGSGVGCFVVGSHVQNLLSANGTEGIEVDVQRILDDEAALLDETLSRIAASAHEHLTPVIYTSRREIRLDDADQRQRLGQQVSDFLVRLVSQLPFTPSYLVGKGGITSHDILTKGLCVRSAIVLGQIVPNVPCVMTDRFPYIIFPGNVGDDYSLCQVYEKLITKRS